MQTVRTFIAVEMSPDVRAAAQKIIKQLAPLSRDVKWVDPQNFHITLSFLGEIEMLDMPRLCAAVSEAAAETPPFDLLLAGAGAFPDVDRPRVVWLGVESGGEELAELQARLDRALRAESFRTEQKVFRPHLTLGRMKGPGSSSSRALSDALAGLAEAPGGATDVSELVVFSSDLRRTGPHYEAMFEAPLAGR